MKRFFSQFHSAPSTGMPCASRCAMNANMMMEGTTFVVSIFVFAGLLSSILLILSLVVLASISSILLLVLVLLVLLAIRIQLNPPASIDGLS